MNGITRICFLIALAPTLASCAREPTLRSIVYREFGPDAVLLDPIASASRKRSFAPGSLAKIDIEQPKDVFRGLAERWNVVQQTTHLCQQKKARLKDMLAEQRPNIIEDYIFDHTLGAPHDRSILRTSYTDLNDNEIGRIGRITFKLTNVVSYSLNQPALLVALQEIQQSRCMTDLRGDAKIAQVAKIYMADMDIKIEKSAGVKLGIGNTRAWIQTSNGFIRRTGKGLIAIVPN